MKVKKRLRSEKEALEIYQYSLKRIALLLQRVEDEMVSSGCYWRVRAECSDLIVHVKKCRVSALCERDKVLESRNIEREVY